MYLQTWGLWFNKADKSSEIIKNINWKCTGGLYLKLAVLQIVLRDKY